MAWQVTRDQSSYKKNNQRKQREVEANMFFCIFQWHHYLSFFLFNKMSEWFGKWKITTGTFLQTVNILAGDNLRWKNSLTRHNRQRKLFHNFQAEFVSGKATKLWNLAWCWSPLPPSPLPTPPMSGALRKYSISRVTIYLINAKPPDSIWC